MAIIKCVEINHRWTRMDTDKLSYLCPSVVIITVKLMQKSLLSIAGAWFFLWGTLR